MRSNASTVAACKQWEAYYLVAPVEGAGGRAKPVVVPYEPTKPSIG